MTTAAIQFRRYEQYASPQWPGGHARDGMAGRQHGGRAGRRLPLCRRFCGWLTAPATVSWLLLAAALTADTATYGLRARRDRALCGCDPTALPDAAPRRIRTTRDAAPR